MTFRKLKTENSRQQDANKIIFLNGFTGEQCICKTSNLQGKTIENENWKGLNNELFYVNQVLIRKCDILNEIKTLIDKQ